jgi:4-amino-4-deoxy-L-arabinose transferase-like glycosyltransferase
MHRSVVATIAMNMRIWSFAKRPLSDIHIARLLAIGCFSLYFFVFWILFFVGSSNGASYGQMIGLNYGEHADPHEYISIAHTMLDTGRFALTPSSPPDFARTPGYPAFLALLLIVFHSLVLLPFIQFLFTACTVSLIYLIGIRYFPRPVALTAAILYLLDPIVLYAAWIPITESLYMFFLIASIYTIGVKAKRTWLPFVIAGILLGISVYFRPIGLYAAPIIACLAFATMSFQRIAFRNAVIFLLTFAFTVCPWMIRNYHLSGHFEFDSVRAWQLYTANMPYFEQVRTGVSYLDIQQKYNAQLGSQDEFVLRSFEYASREDAITKKVLLAHPFEYAAFHIFKSAEYFISSSIVNVTYHMHQLGYLTGDHAQGEGAWGMITQHRWKDALVQIFTHIPTLIERIFLGLIYLGAMYTAFLALRRKIPHHVWIICVFLLLNLFAVIVGPASDDTRYRMPSEPFVFLLGTYAAYVLWPRVRPLLQRVMFFSKQKIDSPGS